MIKRTVVGVAKVFRQGEPRLYRPLRPFGLMEFVDHRRRRLKFAVHWIGKCSGKFAHRQIDALTEHACPHRNHRGDDHTVDSGVGYCPILRYDPQILLVFISCGDRCVRCLQRWKSLRYCPGVKPVALRKTRVKFSCDPKPVSYAISASETRSCASSFCAA